MKQMVRFTLIELLVVIAIIAILAAMLMPGLSHALETAKSIACMSNIKQHSLAINSYLGSFSDTYPVWKKNGTGSAVCISPEDNLVYGMWLITYLYLPQNMKNWYTSRPEKTISNVQVCPSGKTVETASYKVHGRDYLPNYKFQMPSAPIKASRIKGAKIVFAEGVRLQDYFANNAVWSLGFPNKVLGNHNGTANVLWTDGHAEHYARFQMPSQQTTLCYNPEN